MAGLVGANRCLTSLTMRVEPAPTGLSRTSQPWTGSPLRRAAMAGHSGPAQDRDVQIASDLGTAEDLVDMGGVVERRVEANRSGMNLRLSRGARSLRRWRR